MNRYTISGMLTDAAEGKKVAYIGRQAHRGFPALAEAAERFRPSRICRANGGQRIEFANGGRITLHSTERGGRGVSADVVVLDSSVSDDPHTIESAMVMLNTSLSGQLIRAA